MREASSRNPYDSRVTEDAAIRRAAMSVLVASSTSEIVAGLTAVKLPAHEDARTAEAGLMMVRGRIGGDGSVFNLGEATVSRAVVRLDTGELGYGYVLGRDREKARLIALCDALIQNPQHRPAVETNVLAPLRRKREDDRKLAQAQAAATRVDFFTLVRGED